nr:MAG TPA: hypothetical protein [Caudoviricetes sp.]
MCYFSTGHDSVESRSDQWRNVELKNIIIYLLMQKKSGEA